MRSTMTIGKRILRWISPEDEAQRMDLRLAMDTVAAHTEDLNRTLILNGDEIRRKIAEHFSPEITLPPK